MRVLALAACTVALFASDQANAACSKGMLWPYVRNPGDCLTDAELAAGKSGVYNGPLNTAPDVSAIRVEQPAQSQTTSGTTLAPGNYTPGTNGRGLLDEIGLTGLFGGGSTTASAVPAPGTFACNKGYFWPFYRSPGDCLTDIEKKEGQKGVYGGGTGITPVDANANAVASVPSSTPSPAAPASMSMPAASTGGTIEAPAAASCHKGLLWPFLRSAGDCPTDAEKKNGQRAVAPAAVSANTVTSAPAAPSAVAPNMAAPAAATPQAPMVVGANRVTPAPTAAPAPPAPPAPANSSAPAASASDTNANCHKGLFWPFLRGASDCPTDDDKKIGRSTFDPAAVRPAAATTSATTGAPAPSATSGAPAQSGGTPTSTPASDNSSAGCTKGLLWPFVRSAGDCPTDDQKSGKR